jgi:hypothetical protein
MPLLLGIELCRAKLARSDVEGREGARLAGGSDITSLCSACSVGDGDGIGGLGVEGVEFEVEGELPRNKDEEAGEDAREW